MWDQKANSKADAIGFCLSAKANNGPRHRRTYVGRRADQPGPAANQTAPAQITAHKPIAKAAAAISSATERLAAYWEDLATKIRPGRAAANKAAFATTTPSADPSPAGPTPPKRNALLAGGNGKELSRIALAARAAPMRCRLVVAKTPRARRPANAQCACRRIVCLIAAVVSEACPVARAQPAHRIRVRECRFDMKATLSGPRLALDAAGCIQSK